MQNQRKIEVPIALHHGQQAVDEHPARFKVCYCGRRWGKTKYSHLWLLKKAGKPKTINWLLCPTYRQAKDTSWSDLLDLVSRLGIVKKINQTDLRIELKNGSIIALKGCDNENVLRGVKLNSCVLDECAFLKQTIWSDIIRPALADLRGEALFITTPKGRNWLYKLWEYGNTGKDADWASFHFTIYDNPHISREEIAQIKAEVSDLTFKQEFLAEVLANTGQVIPEFDDRKSVFAHGDRFVGHEAWDCVMPIDWGINDDTAVTWLHIEPKTGRVIVSEEHVKNAWSVSRHAEIIKQKINLRPIRPGNMPLDQSAFRQEGTSGTSIGKQFRKEDIPVVPADKNVGVAIEVMKRFFHGDGNEPYVYISHKCAKVIRGLKDWEWGQHEPDAVASVRYGLHHIYKHNISPIFKGMTLVPQAEDNEPGDISQRFKTFPGSNQDNLSWNYETGVPFYG